MSKRMPYAQVMHFYRREGTVKRAVSFTVKTIVRSLFLIGVGFVMLYPVIFMITSALKSSVDAYDPTVIWLPKNSTLDSFKMAFDGLHFPRALWVTIKLTLPCLLFQLLSSVTAAYGFARFQFRGKTVLFGILLFSMIVPTQTYIVPLYASFSNFDFFGVGSLVGLFTGSTLKTNLLDTMIPFYLMALLGAGVRSGLYIFILRQFMINLPRELEDAAYMDGCGEWATFIRVILPNLVPAIVTVAVFSVVWYWNEYQFSGLFLSGDFPLSVMVTTVSSTIETAGQSMIGTADGLTLKLMKDSIMSSACFLVILPLIVLYIFAQRYFTESMERTGLVG